MMAMKFKKIFNRTCVQENSKNACKSVFPKVKTMYKALICFITHCLSSIAFEAGSRYPFGNTVTKSNSFNVLFRKSYNLKIVILATDVIAGLLSTSMLIIADKYGYPYLYLPWLVNTMKGIVIHEGPAIIKLVKVLLPDVSLLAATFMFTSLLLYVEVLCIWKDIYSSFQRCWNNYKSRKRLEAMETRKNVLSLDNKKLFCEDKMGNDLTVVLEKLKDEQKPSEVSRRTNSRNSMDSNLKSIKSLAYSNSNFYQNRVSDITG